MSTRMRIGLMVLLLLSWPAAAQVPAGSPLPAPLSSALDAGTTVSGMATEAKASLHPILVLKGDALVMSLRGKGPIELVVYGPDGSRITRSSGDGAVGMRWSFQADGTHFLAVLAEPGSRYALTLRRVEATPVRAAGDAAWGLYAKLAGRTAVYEGAAPAPAYRMEWAWQTPGRVLVERLFMPDATTPVHTGCIRRRESLPYLTYEVAGGQWPGEVNPATGAVEWRPGPTASPSSRIEWTSADAVLMTTLTSPGAKALYRLTADSTTPTPMGAPCPP